MTDRPPMHILGVEVARTPITQWNVVQITIIVLGFVWMQASFQTKVELMAEAAAQEQGRINESLRELRLSVQDRERQQDLRSDNLADLGNANATRIAVLESRFGSIQEGITNLNNSVEAIQRSIIAR